MIDNSHFGHLEKIEGLQAQVELEALKAEKERTEEEKQKITIQLQQQHKELQSHYQVYDQGFASLCLHLLTDFHNEAHELEKKLKEAPWNLFCTGFS